MTATPDPAAAGSPDVDLVVRQAAADPVARFRHLPERTPPDQLVEEKPVSDPQDPEMGRDATNNWLLRYGA